MGIALSIKNLTFSYDDKVKVLKNINGTLTWVDEA